MRKFEIDRSRWLRGGYPSFLLRRKDRKMCCIGLYLEACGVEEERLVDIADPMGVMGLLPVEAHWLRQGEQEDKTPLDSYAASALMWVNDQMNTITEAEREEAIRARFSSHGVEVTFVDGDGA